jgi:transposase-like protein
MAQRKRYGGQFKARVAMEAIAGHKTVNQISAEHGVHPTQVAKWKKQALQLLPEVLGNGNGKTERRQDSNEGQLYQQIGRLTMEVEYLKKKLDLCQ